MARLPSVQTELKATCCRSLRFSGALWLSASVALQELDLRRDREAFLLLFVRAHAGVENGQRTGSRRRLGRARAGTLRYSGCAGWDLGSSLGLRYRPGVRPE